MYLLLVLLESEVNINIHPLDSQVHNMPTIWLDRRVSSLDLA